MDTLSRAWLPARDAGGATGQTRAADGAGTVFITDGAESPPPVVSMTDLRAKIAALAAELRAGEGVPGYEDCVRGRILLERINRADPLTNVYTQTIERSDPQYNQYWLSGPEHARFQARIIDDDDQSSTGYDHALATARPLPAGTYRVHYHTQHYKDFPCNFMLDDAYIAFTIQVTAPAGTVHEAFFDPVAVGAGVGADDSHGALTPTGFTVGATAATLQRLIWEAQQLQLELSVAAPLANHYLDVIALDGTVALRLRLDDATTAATDSGGQTWRWRACAAPLGGRRPVDAAAASQRHRAARRHPRPGLRPGADVRRGELYVHGGE